jgi:hypothetical protein
LDTVAAVPRGLRHAPPLRALGEQRRQGRRRWRRERRRRRRRHLREGVVTLPDYRLLVVLLLSPRLPSKGLFEESGMRTAALSSREKKEWKRVLVSGWRRGLGLGCGLDPVNTARTRVAFGISVNDIMGPCGNRAIGEVAAVDLDPINLFFLPARGLLCL